MPDETVGAEPCVALGATSRTLDSYPSKEVRLGALPVTRALPIRERRLVGPWCFLDRFGPQSFSDQRPMDVAPHPHIGLQTVTWLVSGEVRHYDSLGAEALARPGGVNVMTAGGGIAHAERSPAPGGTLDGVQLWVALPDPHRGRAPAFEAIERVPVIERPGGRAQVFAGSISGVTAPARHFSDLGGADLQVAPGGELGLDLDPAWEHAVLMLAGDASIEGQPLEPRRLYYLGTHRTDLTVASRTGGRLLLVGGPPFPETILMWWNFVARTPAEIARARADWEARVRFGEVAAYGGPRLEAPALARFAAPNPAS